MAALGHGAPRVPGLPGIMAGLFTSWQISVSKYAFVGSHGATTSPFFGLSTYSTPLAWPTGTVGRVRLFGELVRIRSLTSSSPDLAAK